MSSGFVHADYPGFVKDESMIASAATYLPGVMRFLKKTLRGY